MAARPKIEHVYQNHHMDSTRWNWFTPRDDDIVMRQIREAAMKETNPELREKLWDEYRRIRDQR